MLGFDGRELIRRVETNTIDELSAGDLTGGRTIAATGTIEPDGTVGEVGGVVQKTAAVRRAAANRQSPESSERAGGTIKLVFETMKVEFTRRRALLMTPFAFAGAAVLGAGPVAGGP